MDQFNEQLGEQLGLKLRALREQAGLSQADVARSLGVTAAAVGHFEKNRRSASIGFVVKAADFFNVPVDELLAMEEQPEGELA